MARTPHQKTFLINKKMFVVIISYHSKAACYLSQPSWNTEILIENNTDVQHENLWEDLKHHVQDSVLTPAKQKAIVFIT